MSSESETTLKTPNNVHKRRKSSSRYDEIQSQEWKIRKAQPDRPVHRAQDSILSWSSNFNHFTGFVNWAFLLLTLGGTRLMLENLIKYGVRVDPLQWALLLTADPSESFLVNPMFRTYLYANVFIVIALIIEKGLASGQISEQTGAIVHGANLLMLLILPIVIINTQAEKMTVLGATSSTFLYTIIFLKLWSYVQVNSWCRLKLPSDERKSIKRSMSTASPLNESNGQAVGSRSSKKPANVVPVELVNYPDNLNMSDMYYFMMAPTLCYELNFPRTNKIRKTFLIKRLIEVIVIFQVLMSLLQQWIIPSVKHSLTPFSEMDIAKIVERLLKLAIPNHLLWLMMFYVVFHSFYNLLGEILMFADRDFYEDWWNSNNTVRFWRTWNVPVHRWAVRHLYIPLLEAGASKHFANIVVFFISAFFHEYLVSVPLRTYKVWAFMGMMGQLPLSVISVQVEKKYNPRFGNIIVWGSLIIGQPLCIMMYYHDYVITHFGKDVIDQFSHVGQ